MVLTAASCGGRNGGRAAAGPSFRNPVYRFDAPDPFVLKVGAMYYAYTTAAIGSGGFIQELKSRDLMHWTPNGDALPIPPRWLDKDVWGPTVIKEGKGRYVLYYSADYPQTLNHCLGRGVSTSPQGPFRDSGNKPFMCQDNLGGAIDPELFRDTDGKVYLYWKNDGNHAGHPTYIWVRQLSSDGMSFVGKPVALIHNSQGWEQDVIEAPSMVKHDGRYYLFFSGYHWNSISYAVGYARCAGPEGPCSQAANNPILRYHAGCEAEGPGGQTITTDARGQTWMLYHAWLGDATDYDVSGGTRALWLDPLNWKDGNPVVSGPTCKPEPGPVIGK